ncbi:MAG: Uma2 family endonuclease [Longimicrobiales bacterium]
MTATGQAREWTYADYAALPDDGNRYEVLDGEVLVTPAPGTNHQEIVGRLFRILFEYVDRHRLGRIYYDVDLLFQPHQYLRPDLLFVPSEEKRRLVERGMEGVPGLVVEVISPGSKQHDSVTKPARYRDFGVLDYWAVDPARRVVYVYDFRTSDEPRAEKARVTWKPNPIVEPLELDVRELFEEPDW